MSVDWTTGDIAEARNLYHMGLAPEQIALILGRSPGAIAFKVMPEADAQRYMAPIWARYREQRYLQYTQGLAEAKVHRLQADKYRCVLCGNPYYAVCHIIGFDLARSHDFANLLSVCKSCYGLVRNDFCRMMTRAAPYWTQEKETALERLLKARGFLYEIESPVPGVRYLQIYHPKFYAPPATFIARKLTAMKLIGSVQEGHQPGN